MTLDETPVVKAHDISYRKRSYRSFEFASFEVRAGEVLALLAASHAPARDVLLAVAGLVRPTSGTIEVACGEAASTRRPRGASRGTSARVGLGVFERVAPVSESLSTEELVQSELRVRGGSGDALELLAAMGAATQAGEQVARLEPGARARLSAALALAGDPAAAVIDLTDPFVNGVSTDTMVALMNDVKRYALERGIAVIVATSESRCAQVATRAVPLDISAADEFADPSEEVTA